MILFKCGNSNSITFLAAIVALFSTFVHSSILTLPFKQNIVRNSVCDLVGFLKIPNLLEGKTNPEYPTSVVLEDTYLNISQLIHKYGYNVEQHHVETEDGYILTMFRMRKSESHGRAVLLMHGFLGSADDWVTTGPEGSLACLLASKGYDVWMGNARGNKHSRKHANMSTDDPKFWKFSWHEIGYYDLPAMIDYILNTTFQAQLKYISYSQGTTVFLVMCSERPEYNDKILQMIALSMIAFMSHVTSPLFRLISLLNPEVHQIFSLIGYNELSFDNLVLQALKAALCGTMHFPVCENVLFLIFGFDYPQVNYKYSHVIFAHTPAGASTNQFIHYLQGVESGKFCKFDYGAKEKNIIEYGSAYPPEYEVEKIRTPIIIVHAENDWVSNIVDVDKLRSKLPNVIDFFVVPYKDFCHTDYLYAVDVYKLLYYKVLEFVDDEIIDS